MSKPCRVLIVDDHAMVRAGCAALLSRRPGIEIVEAANGEEALRLAKTLRPDVVVLDLNLPDLSGFEVLKRVRAEHSGQPVLVFSMYEDPVFAARAIEAGANAFVSKSDRPETLLEAFEAVKRGDDYLSHSMAQKLAMMKLRGSDHPLRGLTRRELDILRMFVSGKSLGEIAGALGISYRTVANVVSIIKRKLNVGTTTKLLLVAAEYLKSHSAEGPARFGEATQEMQKFTS